MPICYPLKYTQSGNEGQFRLSSANAFLNDSVVTPSGKGVNGRKLTVKLKSTALRTIWKGNKAIGIEYFHDGKIKKAYAKKGVIVCAGLFSSAFLATLNQMDNKYKLIFPTPEIIDDTNLLTTFIKEAVMSNQCWQSHCRMAPLGQGGVVDGTGRVYGVENLFVADDSIVPCLWMVHQWPRPI